MKPKSLLIHNNNSPIKNKVTEKLSFGLETFGSSVMGNNFNIDSYISTKIISKIKDIEFDVLYIKDSLSSNYMEFYGLLVAYHVRLSKELGDKRFVPIIILSELDGYIINKLTYLGTIVFTKNVFISKNTVKSFEYFQQNISDKLSLSAIEYRDNFLNIIDVPPPKDYLSHHSIANEWAIDRWANFLNINDSKAINQNRDKISSMLYFKYLLAKNMTSKSSSISSCVYPVNTGNILYIDDEHDKGWSDILKNYFSENSKINFSTLAYKFKDKNAFAIRAYIKKEVKRKKPDLVILDLRLTENDHKNKNREDINKYTGIEVLNDIKKINQGIQVLMLTATGKSVILNKLYEYNILGYIKKEHPEDKNITTSENFAKLARLSSKGFEKSYLKKIWDIQKNILKLNLFKEEDDSFKQIKLEVNSVFEILDSDIENRLNYAMFAIFKCIEIITALYIEEQRRNAYWINGNQIRNTGYLKLREELYTSNFEHIKNENLQANTRLGNSSIENKIRTIMNEKLGLKSNRRHSHIKCLVCIRNHTIHQDKQYEDKDFCKKVVEEKISKEDILTWFKMLQTILKKINQ